MIVFPLIRLVGLKAATASSRVETVPMFDPEKTSVATPRDAAMRSAASFQK
jgi:hypothetical protein